MVSKPTGVEQHRTKRHVGFCGEKNPGPNRLTNTTLPSPSSSLDPILGVRIQGTLGEIDPLNKLLFKRAISRVKKGPL